MVFEQGVYVIEHDPERTGDFYARKPGTTCDCTGCRNFRAALGKMSVEMRGFLEQFGIDPAKPAEMTPLCAVGREALCYDGFYHFCGEIREGLEPFVKKKKKSFQMDPRYQISVGVQQQYTTRRHVRCLGSRT